VWVISPREAFSHLFTEQSVSSKREVDESIEIPITFRLKKED
jgi:hypothetical protein